MLIKSRKAKLSSRGIYLQDRKLSETTFQPGTHFKYLIDITNRQVVILPSEDPGSNTVSKRELKQLTKPVLDIRNKEALSAFSGCEYLEVEIYEEQIIVRGFVAGQEAAAGSKLKRLVASLAKKKQKVRGIKDFLQVKERVQIVLSRKQLSAAVGNYEQLSFSFEELDGIASWSSVRHIEKALGDLQIPLQLDSLFTGAGLMDLGFIKAGFQVAFAVEKDPDAVQTYRANLGQHILQADINQVDQSRFASPVMIGGSPCQGFSNENRYSNYLNNPNNLLLRAFIEKVKRNEQCQVFVLENVPQMLTAGGGRVKANLIEALQEFEITCGVLNAADYGAPQLRERGIVIGSKIGRIDLPEPSVKERLTVRDAFEGLHSGVANQRDISASKDITLERIRSVPAGGNVHDIPEAIRPKGTHSNMYKRLRCDEPSITIVNPRKAMILHPEENRILSVRECARIQGVDDDFIFEGSLNARQQQVANGVPVQLSQAIAEAVRNAILKFNIRNRSSVRWA